MTVMDRLKKMLGLTRENIPLWGASIGHGYTHWFPATFYLLLPLIKKEFGLSYTEMGFMVTVRFISSTVANFPSGMIADVVGRHHLIMTVALAWVGIPYLLVGISGNYAVLLICMVLLGIGNNLWHPAAMSSLNVVYPQKRGWAMGWHASAANMGDALGPFMSGILLTWLTWRQILIGSAIPGLGMGLFIWWLLGTSPHKELADPVAGDSGKTKKLSAKQYFRGFGRLLINRNVFFLAFINGIRSLTQNGLSTFLPPYFMTVLNISPWLSGVYITIIQVAGIIASPISGRASDTYGRKRVVTAALFSTSVAVLLLVFVQHRVLFVVFLGGVGFFLYSLRPVLIAWAMELAPKELAGSVIGLQFSFQSGLSALAPVVGGWIADHWGLMATFYFLAATVILSNVLVVFIRESEESHEKLAA
jgi:MFS transporter, FSR family, fosmidomycin resistance protein